VLTVIARCAIVSVCFRKGGIAVFARVVLVVLGLFSITCAYAQTLYYIDFRNPLEVARWQPTHAISRLLATGDGMQIEISGEDPYTIGPAYSLPSDKALYLRIRVKAEVGTFWQIFYFRDGTWATEEQSVRFFVPQGTWGEQTLILPVLPGNYRFRIDPPGPSGRAWVRYMSIEVRHVPQEPQWLQPVPPTLQSEVHEVRSGDVVLRHGPPAPGNFELLVAGERMATGFTRPMIGYQMGAESRWLALHSAIQSARLWREGIALVVEYRARDADGGNWLFIQRFSPNPVAGTIDLQTQVSVDQPREVYFLPMLLLLPGMGSYGTSKGQGLFAGLEYLENEPSSSEADVIGAAARRQVPDNLKITFPLMAIQARGRYVGLIWQPDEKFCALFDSPDRFFASGAHVMGILSPGSDGVNREEGKLLPSLPIVLQPNQLLVLNAILIGGRGESVVPAVQHYVRLRGLPPLPNIGMTFTGYVSLAAGGWLDSRIREGYLFRHAYWPGFNAQPAADAAVLMEWLAGYAADPNLAQRLRETAIGAIAQVPAWAMNFYNISHNAYPVAALVYGHVAENMETARQVGWQVVSRFEPDGTLIYRPEPGKPDYGRTHRRTGRERGARRAALRPPAWFAALAEHRDDLHQLDLSRVVRTAGAMVRVGVCGRAVPPGAGRPLRRPLASHCRRHHRHRHPDDLEAKRRRATGLAARCVLPAPADAGRTAHQPGHGTDGRDTAVQRDAGVLSACPAPHPAAGTRARANRPDFGAYSPARQPAPFAGGFSHHPVVVSQLLCAHQRAGRGSAGAHQRRADAHRAAAPVSAVGQPDSAASGHEPRGTAHRARFPCACSACRRASRIGVY
jgi:hypothetical protein